MALQDQHELVERRRENLRRLCKDKFNDSRAEMARVAQIHANQINLALTDNEKNQRPIGENLARRLEKNLGLPAGFLDQKASIHDAVEIVAYQVLPEMQSILAQSTALYALSVTQNWIKSNHITMPDRLLIAEVANDGMSPDILPGEQVILESLMDEDNQPAKPEAGFSKDGIYIIGTKVGPMLRRIMRTTDAQYAITSPNKTYPPENRATLKGMSFYARVVTPLRFGN